MKNDKPSLRQRLTAVLGHCSRRWLQHCTPAAAQSGQPAKITDRTSTTADDELILDSVRHSFSSELFAELLSELPEYQQKLALAYQSGDLTELGNDVHQLLGAIVYCDAPELEGALRALHRALASTDTESIDACYLRVSNTINSTLNYIGFACRR